MRVSYCDGVMYSSTLMGTYLRTYLRTYPRTYPRTYLPTYHSPPLLPSTQMHKVDNLVRHAGKPMCYEDALRRLGLMNKE